jgi:hypothetical protein
MDYTMHEVTRADKIMATFEQFSQRYNIMSTVGVIQASVQPDLVTRDNG